MPCGEISRKDGIGGLSVEVADCAERRFSSGATLSGETAFPLDGKEMLCIWLLRPAVGDLGSVGAAVTGDGDPRERFVEERRRFRKGEREERNGPRIFCCCCVFGSREEVGGAPLTLRKEEEVDGACEELVIGLPSSPASADGVVAGEITVGAGKPAEVFGRRSGGAGLCATAGVSTAVSVGAEFFSSAFAAAAAAAAVFL